MYTVEILTRWKAWTMLSVLQVVGCQDGRWRRGRESKVTLIFPPQPIPNHWEHANLLLAMDSQSCQVNKIKIVHGSGIELFGKCISAFKTCIETNDEELAEWGILKDFISRRLSYIALTYRWCSSLGFCKLILFGRGV